MSLVRQLQLPLAPVVAMADYRIGDGLHRRLRGYKDAPRAEDRRRFAEELGGMAERWLSVHREGLARRFGVAWDVVATVPSSHRPSGPAVDAVVGRVSEFRRHHRPLLVRGPALLDHLVASRRGFDLSVDVEPQWLRGRSVLVVDDSLVTGARAQSAVATLRSGGAGVVGIVVLGRVVPSPPACLPTGSRPGR
jgi:adenine/guanine phosphoribosyltransferase-like PRPP-binding protein